MFGRQQQHCLIQPFCCNDTAVSVSSIDEMFGWINCIFTMCFQNVLYDICVDRLIFLSCFCNSGEISACISHHCFTETIENFKFSCEGADIIFPPSIFSFEKPFFALLKLLRQLREAKWEGFRCKFYMNRQEKEKSSIQNRSFRRIVCCLGTKKGASPTVLMLNLPRKMKGMENH